MGAKILLACAIVMVCFIGCNVQTEKITTMEREIVKQPTPFSFPAVEISISQYDSIVKKYSKRYGFDWRFISAQVFVESSFVSTAVSRCGAKGLMQIMPSTSEWLGVDPDTLFDPEINISLGIYYNFKLYHGVGMLDTEQDRLSTMIASFNAGPGRVKRIRRQVGNGHYDKFSPSLPQETRQYVSRIWKRYSLYQGKAKAGDCLLN